MKKLTILCTCLLMFFLCSCGKQEVIEETTEYLTVDIALRTEEPVAEPIAKEYTFNTEGYKDFLSQFTYSKFSQYKDNGEEVSLIYSVEADAKSKIYNIKDTASGIEYWSDFGNVKFLKVDNYLLEEMPGVEAHLGIGEAELANAYDLWVALCKDFTIQDGAIGTEEDGAIVFKTVTKAKQSDVSNLGFSKLGNKEVVHTFYKMSDDSIGVPKSVSVKVYYYVNDEEYSVSSSLVFDNFSVYDLVMPEIIVEEEAEETTEE